MKIAHGAYLVKPFTKGLKVRRTAHHITRDQDVTLSPWGVTVNVRTHVDVDRSNARGVLQRPVDVRAVRLRVAPKVVVRPTSCGEVIFSNTPRA